MIELVSLCIAGGFAAFTIGVWALFDLSEHLDEALQTDPDSSDRSRF